MSYQAPSGTVFMVRPELPAPRAEFGILADVPGTRESCETIIEKAGIKNWRCGKDKVFLKYYHPDELSVLVRKSRDAYRTVERACRGLICRVRYRKIRAGKAAQAEAVAAMIGLCETQGGAAAGRCADLMARDAVADELLRLVAEAEAEEETGSK